MRIEHLTEDAQKKRHVLDGETTETLTTQVCRVTFCGDLCVVSKLDGQFSQGPFYP